MSSKLRILVLVILVAFTQQLQAQQVSIGKWQTYMPYGEGVDVVDAGDKIYCIAKYGLFYIQKSDSSMEVITKLDGLSDVSVKAAAYDQAHKTLFVGYDNVNVDIIRNNTISNFNDIMKKDMTGLKVLNSIDIYGGNVYFNCGFGTVVYDIGRSEVKDTYYLGTNGAELAVYNISVLGSKIYAATDSGILEADYANPNLANYQNWRRHDLSDSYPGGPCYSLTSFNNHLFASIQGKTQRYNGTLWDLPPGVYQGGVDRLRASTQRLMVINTYSVVAYDSNLNGIDIYNTPAFANTMASANYDQSGKLWMADRARGFFNFSNGQVSGRYVPDGPFHVSSRRMAIKNHKLIVAGGSVGDNYSNRYTSFGIYTYNNGFWRNYNYLNYPAVDTFYDIIVAAYDPKNNKEYYGTFWKGLLEFENGELTTIYGPQNSSLGEALGNDGQYRVTGLAFDSKNNLWVANHWAENPISVRKANGQWQSFSFPGVFSEYKYVADITVDRNDQKWVIMPSNNAILVFKEKTDGTTTYKRLSAGAGSGNLPKEATQVYSITEDLDGKIWVGTDKGIVVFYSPATILQPGADIDAQEIKVVDGEFVQPLLGTETVYAIKVDGANRKWMGTRNGAWLFSADGTKQIEYFNTGNSPILSNKINDIAIDPATGVVYFATDNGIASYRGSATSGGNANADNVKVFPNPVKETFSGLIAIQGLVRNASVKITDVNGTIVYQTNADGGQATWNGKNFKGEKVSTGVYLAFCTDEEGNETIVKKIMFIK